MVVLLFHSINFGSLYDDSEEERKSPIDDIRKRRGDSPLMYSQNLREKLIRERNKKSGKMVPFGGKKTRRARRTSSRKKRLKTKKKKRKSSGSLQNLETYTRRKARIIYLYRTKKIRRKCKGY